MDARDVARGVDLDDVIEKARKTAAAASAIAKITRAEASEAQKHARDVAKEVRAHALAFDKGLTAKCTCSTQPSQRARLLTAIKQNLQLLKPSKISKQFYRQRRILLPFS